MTDPSSIEGRSRLLTDLPMILIPVVNGRTGKGKSRGEEAEQSESRLEVPDTYSKWALCSKADSNSDQPE